VTDSEPRFGVPAYFHPEYEPQAWRILAGLGPRLAFAILNPDSGPGEGVDRAYLEPITEVHAAGGTVIGYVDTDYGRRPGSAVLQDLVAYRYWYGLHGVFLDQVPSGREHLAHYRGVAAAARRIGLEFLAVNPGVTPDPGYAELAHVVSDWVRSHPPERFCHLVHSAPSAELASTRDAVEDCHAGAVYITEVTGANPWGRLSAQLDHTPAA
jgi:hypothetical protein